MAKLIKCKDCGQEISKRAKACPNCGAEVKRTSLFTWIVTIFAVIFMISQFSGGGNTARTVSRVKVEEKPRLDVQSFRCEFEHGYHSIVGEVKNISPKKIDNVMAVGVFVTASGEVVKTDQSLIDYNPIMPNQTSPFKIMTTSNPQIKSCKLSFKTMFGGQIMTKGK